MDSIGRRSVTPPTPGQTVITLFPYTTTTSGTELKSSQANAIDVSQPELAKGPNAKGEEESQIASREYLPTRVSARESSDTALDSLLNRKERKHRKESEDLQKKFEGSMAHLQVEHAKAINKLLNSQEKQEKELKRQMKAESSKKAVVEKKLGELISKYTQQSKYLEALETKYKSETRMFHLLLKAKGQQVSKLYDRLDSTVGEVSSVHQQYQQVITTYKSEVVTPELKIAQNPQNYPADGSALQLAVNQAKTLTENLLDMTKLKIRLEAKVDRQQKELESQEGKALEMTKLKDHLEAEVLRHQQNANDYLNKNHQLQGILEYHPGSNAYQFDSMIEEKNRQYRDLEKRTATLLDAHEHLKIMTKIDAAQRGTRILQLTEALDRRTEEYQHIQEQKEGFEAANESILKMLKLRLTKSDVVENLKEYHEMVVRNSKKLAERVHEQGHMLNAAKEEAAGWENRFLEMEREPNDLSAMTEKVQELEDVKRALEHDKGSLKIDIDIPSRT